MTFIKLVILTECALVWYSMCGCVSVPLSMLAVCMCVCAVKSIEQQLTENPSERF